MLDGKIEIITGRARRRRWSVEDKLRIVAETYEPGSHINVVAVRHDISVSLLHGWRHQVRHGLLRSEGGATGFVPVRVVAAQRAGSCYPAPSSAIEVALPDGSRLYIQDGANAATLRHIIAALRS